MWKYPFYYIAYHTYSFRAFMIQEFEGRDGFACPCTASPRGCPEGEEDCTMTGEEVLEMYAMEDQPYGQDMGILIAWAVGYRWVGSLHGDVDRMGCQLQVGSQPYSRPPLLILSSPLHSSLPLSPSSHPLFLLLILPSHLVSPLSLVPSHSLFASSISFAH